MEMNEIIKSLRIENKLTQEELAQKLGIQKSAVAKYESGRVENIKRSTIQKMADIFGVEPSYVLGWGERKNDNATSFEKRMLEYAEKLNDLGKNKLIERAEELTYIPKYQATYATKESTYKKPIVAESSSYLTPMAAHNDYDDEDELRLMQEDLDDL